MNRAISIVLGVGLIAVSFASQDSIKIQRTYKEGDKDSYKMNIVATTAMGPADINMVMNQTIKRVYENGDADMENAISDMHVLFNGNEVPVPQPPSSTQRVNRMGFPVGEDAKGHGMMHGMDFMRYSGMMLDKPLVAGQTYPIEQTDEKNPKNHVSGSVKVDSITDGVAKLLTSLDVFTDKATKPMKIIMTVLMDSASSKPNRIEGTVTDLPTQETGGPEVSDVKFTMERLK
jgi:hypothetical protein